MRKIFSTCYQVVLALFPIAVMPQKVQQRDFVLRFISSDFGQEYLDNSVVYTNTVASESETEMHVSAA